MKDCGFNIETRQSSVIISLFGAWRVVALDSLEPSLNRLDFSGASSVVVDCSQLQSIDTASATILIKSILATEIDRKKISFQKFNIEQGKILQLVEASFREKELDLKGKRAHFLEVLGEEAVASFEKLQLLLAFIGAFSVEFLRTILNPHSLRFKELVVQLEYACLNAIPVVCLVTFLIGLVMAYLFGIQAEQYGANIFIVDAVGLAMCREFSPILVAIIVAGRSGSAFTAQIGAMKLNDELDALVSLGLSPMRVLVLPRVLALIIAMPLLVFIGDIVGITGAMFISDLRLGIKMTTFVDRLQQVIPVMSFNVGLIKAPVFAAFIALIGCRMGIFVERDARSLGMSTTSTVVQSIVSVILLNAAFAVIFVELGI